MPRGRLSLKLGKFGAFVGCSNYPECRYTRPLEVRVNGDQGGAQAALEGPKILGSDPATGLPVALRKGPYGYYVQLGGEASAKAADTGKSKAKAKENAKEKAAEKPKRVSLPRGVKPEEVTIALALQLLSLPREIGHHPETGKPITAGIGRFGPYIKHESSYKSLGTLEEVLTIGLNRAVDLLSQAKGRGSTTLHELGPHPADARPVRILKGRYGPYLKHGSLNAPMPKGKQPDAVTLEEAVELLAAHAARAGSAGKTKSRKGAGASRKSKAAATAE